MYSEQRAERNYELMKISVLIGSSGFFADLVKLESGLIRGSIQVFAQFEDFSTCAGVGVPSGRS